MRLNIFLIITFAFLISFSCDNDLPNKYVPFSIQLTDAPGDYDQVNIDLLQVKIRYEDQEEFVDVNTQWGTYDLLQLQNGVDTLIVSDTIPAGEISQIRLVLGPNSTVMIDSTLKDLKTPSAEQSGLKINVNRGIHANRLNEITLDFDACESVVERGNGEYNLKPVIRVLE